MEGEEREGKGEEKEEEKEEEKWEEKGEENADFDWVELEVGLGDDANCHAIGGGVVLDNVVKRKELDIGAIIVFEQQQTILHHSQSHFQLSLLQNNNKCSSEGRHSDEEGGSRWVGESKVRESKVREGKVREGEQGKGGQGGPLRGRDRHQRPAISLQK